MLTNEDIKPDDKVWDENRKERGLQPNGKVKWINWRDEEVTVTFFESGDEIYELAKFEGCFECQHGGIWMLYKD